MSLKQENKNKKERVCTIDKERQSNKKKKENKSSNGSLFR